MMLASFTVHNQIIHAIGLTCLREVHFYLDLFLFDVMAVRMLVSKLTVVQTISV